MPYLYPLILDIAAHPVVIIGGGKVAVRKAKGLLAAGAECVTVVSPEVDAEMPAGVRQIPEMFPDHLEGATLVFAATNQPAVNQAIVLECRRRGILVNRADVDDETSGDFTTPALMRKGELLVTVSAGGSAALASRVRDEIENGLDEQWVALAEALASVRPMMRRQKQLTQCQRAGILREIAGETGRDIVAREGAEGILRWIENRIAEIRPESSEPPRC